MNKLALLALTVAPLVILPACIAEDAGPEPSEEGAGEAASALTIHGNGWAFVNMSGALWTPYVYNSSGGSVTTAKLATGQYSVDFNGISYTPPSNAQVTAVGTNVHCKLFTTPTGNGLKTSLFVNCYTPGGAFADAAFLVTLDSRSGTSPAPDRGAFLSTGGGASPTPLQSWNSAGMANSILWNSAQSRYEVTLPGLSLENAGVHVTALGANANRCKVQGWIGGVVRVQCFNSAGTPVSSNGFSLSYQERALLPAKVGVHTWVSGGAPQSSYSGGYATFTCWASALSAVSSGQDLVVSATNTNAAGTASSFVPMVTAYGTGSHYCNISGWSASGTTSSATVSCYDTTGAQISAGSAAFDLSMTSRDMPGPC